MMIDTIKKFVKYDIFCVLDWGRVNTPRKMVWYRGNGSTYLFDDNGNKIDKESYARSSTMYKVDITKTPYFIITDPTFIVTYYFGFRSRILDVYYYDKDMNFIKCVKGKFRHGLLKAPEGTEYINLAIPLVTDESLPTRGHGDFGNCILSIKTIYPTEKCFFKKCEIKNNYSCHI